MRNPAYLRDDALELRRSATGTRRDIGALKFVRLARDLEAEAGLTDTVAQRNCRRGELVPMMPQRAGAPKGKPAVSDVTHCLTYGEHRLRFLKGPRFDGDLPWWFAEDVLNCVADLLGRPDRMEMMLHHLLATCPAEDRVDVTGPAADPGVHTAISEFELWPMIMALGDVRHRRLQALGNWFLAAAGEATLAVGGNLEFACARRGICLDHDRG